MKIQYFTGPYSQQRQHEKKANIYPVLMAMEAEWQRRQGHQVYWNTYVCNPDRVIRDPEGLPFLSLPAPDRVFTNAKDYTSGNYKYLPGTHIQSANGCWWGRCSFCVEKGSKYEVRPVESVINEIVECKKLGFKEVFDDSATFPTGEWLEKFCREVPKGLVLGCNMRICNDIDFAMLRNANFRMLLFGIESANQYTLNKINKGVKVEDIIPTIKKAAESGLDCHLAVMFGYPWETDQDAERTLKLVRYLLRKGYAKTAQASFFNQEGLESNSAHKRYVRNIYGVWKYSDFWLNQLRDIHNMDDLKYLWRKISSALY